MCFAYLRTILEVSLVKRLVDPRLRDCESGVASWERVGEAGGPLYVAVRRSLSWPPWKVLRLAVPRGKRRRSGGVALLMLWVEAPGLRCEEAVVVLGGRNVTSNFMNFKCNIVVNLGKSALVLFFQLLRIILAPSTDNETS